MHLCLKLDTPDSRAEVPCWTPLPWVAWDAPLLLWGRTRSPRESGQNRMPTTRSVSLEQLPNTSLAPQSGCAGEHWLQDNHGGLTPRRSMEETSRAINCSTEHLGGCQSPLGKPLGALGGHSQGECAAGEVPSPTCKARSGT